VLVFRQSTDQHSLDIVRDDKPLGFLQWHRGRHRIILWAGPGVELSLAELEQCVVELTGKSAKPGGDWPDVEIGRELPGLGGARKARVDYNRVSAGTEEGRFGVFMRTYYQHRWYYDGYRDFEELEDAVAFRNAWLQGASASWNPPVSNTSLPETCSSSSVQSSPTGSVG